jgi:hypothetical protein
VKEIAGIAHDFLKIIGGKNIIKYWGAYVEDASFSEDLAIHWICTSSHRDIHIQAYLNKGHCVHIQYSPIADQVTRDQHVRRLSF